MQQKRTLLGGYAHATFQLCGTRGERFSLDSMIPRQLSIRETNTDIRDSLVLTVSMIGSTMVMVAHTVSIQSN